MSSIPNLTAALIYLASSALALVIIAGVFRVEDAREGRLVVFKTARVLFDKIITMVFYRLSKLDTYIGKGFARLMLHYAAHNILRSTLLLIQKLENKIKGLLKRNTQVAKDLRLTKEKTHLDHIAEHRIETALSDAQKKKMRSHDAHE